MKLRDLYRASPHAAAAKRQILRDALRSAVRLGIDIGIDLPGLNTARLGAMIDAADRLPDSIAALLADRLATPGDACLGPARAQAEAPEAEAPEAEAPEAEAPEVEAPEATEAEATEAPEAPEAPAPFELTDLADQIRGLLSGDLGTLSARVSALADSAAAATAAAEAQARAVAAPTSTGTAPAVSVRVVGRKTLGTLLPGLSKNSPVRDHKITVCQTTGATVPPVDPDYSWPEHSAAALLTIEDGAHIFWCGPRGTGKSTWAEQAAAITGRPFTRVTFSAQTQLVDLLGSVALEGGQTYWRPGPLVQAYCTPYSVILLDEPSLAPAETLTGLNGLLDGLGVTLPDGRHVTPAPGVAFILADNTNGTGDGTGLYTGTGTMNAAFRDRASITLRAQYLPAAQEARMLAARVGAPEPVCTALIGFAQTTRDAAEAGALSEGLGPRRLLALARLISRGIPGGMALEIAVLTGLDEADATAMRQLAAAGWPADSTWRAMLSGSEAPAAQSQDPAQARARADFAAADTE